jgi:hypothetical protein
VGTLCPKRDDFVHMSRKAYLSAKQAAKKRSNRSESRSLSG